MSGIKMTVEEKLIKLAGMFPNKHVALVYVGADNDYSVWIGVREYPFRRGYPAAEALTKMLKLEPNTGGDYD